MESKKSRIINSPWTLIVAVATVGPLAIPLVWQNPHYTTKTKVILSVAIVIFTGALLYFSGKFLKDLNDQISALQP
jgi:hypothetical protein